jgi:hypothetical protein
MKDIFSEFVKKRENISNIGLLHGFQYSMTFKHF